MKTAWWAGFALLLTLIPATLRAEDASLVEIATQLEPASAVVPGQRVRLVITVATPRWFTAGTRIKLPEVPGLILLQNQDFAANTTERRGRDTWSVQRWTIDAFATTVGTIEVPPLAVSVSVSKTPSQELKETRFTQALTITSQLPPALADIDDWIASPEVSVEQRVETASEVALGSAIRRQIVVKAKDVMAMQLPNIGAGSDSLLQTYPEPPVLRNRANRGALNAERRDTVTWIATSPGETTIPGVSIHWWNTETRDLTVLSTEPIPLTITGELAARPLSREQLMERGLYGLGAVVMTLALLRLGQSGLLRRLLETLGALVKRSIRVLHRAWRHLRDPVLPTRLNPGGTRGASSADEPPAR